MMSTPDRGRWLRIPGPTPLHPNVVAAMGREMIPHRGPAMRQLLDGMLAKARLVHQTEHNVFVWPGSGSAGWEAAIVNLLSPGDRVVATVCGDFGDRFASLGERFALAVERVTVPWGQAVTPAKLAAALASAGDVRAVFLTHNETSTGVTNPLPDLARLARDAGALVIVDAVSSAAGLPLEMDEWGLDWVISGSQKAWMCPPGLMIAGVSARAMDAAEGNGYPRFFWDVRSMSKSTASGSTPSTPPLSLLYAFDAALDIILDEGIDSVWQRHAYLGTRVRESLQEHGFALFADAAFASNTVTAFRPPDGVVASELRDRVRADSGIEIAVGQGDYANAVNRIGHMGWVAAPELDATVASIARCGGAIESPNTDAARLRA
jgi:aspartate aminotransferase-like enzyme